MRLPGGFDRFALVWQRADEELLSATAGKHDCGSLRGMVQDQHVPYIIRRRMGIRRMSGGRRNQMRAAWG